MQQGHTRLELIVGDGRWKGKYKSSKDIAVNFGYDERRKERKFKMTQGMMTTDDKRFTMTEKEVRGEKWGQGGRVRDTVLLVSFPDPV